jgi:hypothetical protein
VTGSFSGGSFPNEIYTPPVSVPSISFGSSVITFSNLADHRHSRRAFTFNGTAAGTGSTLRTRPSRPRTARLAARALTCFGDFERIDCSRANVTRSAGGGDTIVLNNPNLAEG